VAPGRFEGGKWDGSNRKKGNQGGESGYYEKLLAVKEKTDYLFKKKRKEGITKTGRTDRAKGEKRAPRPLKARARQLLNWRKSEQRQSTPQSKRKGGARLPLPTRHRPWGLQKSLLMGLTRITKRGEKECGAPDRAKQAQRNFWKGEKKYNSRRSYRS